MGFWYKPRKRAKGKVKVIDPKPIWEVTIQEEGKPPYKIYANTKLADKYFKAGFPVKMVTKAGYLRDMEEEE